MTWGRFLKDKENKNMFSDQAFRSFVKLEMLSGGWRRP
jgi:hypothetical protein